MTDAPPPKPRRRRRPAKESFRHHYIDDMACPACGTDSSTGCVAAHVKP